jgi:hypothetical protein
MTAIYTGPQHAATDHEYGRPDQNKSRLICTVLLRTIIHGSSLRTTAPAYRSEHGKFE